MGTIGETPCSDAEARLRGWTGGGTGMVYRQTLAFVISIFLVVEIFSDGTL